MDLFHKFHANKVRENQNLGKPRKSNKTKKGLWLKLMRSLQRHLLMKCRKEKGE